MKKKYFDKLSRAKLSELYQFSTSDILTRFDAEISQIVTFNVVTLMDIFSDALMLSFIIIYIGANNAFLLSFLLLTPFIILLTKRCRTDFADIQNKKESGGNRQWQRRFLRNWVENTNDREII